MSPSCDICEGLGLDITPEGCAECIRKRERMRTLPSPSQAHEVGGTKIITARYAGVCRRCGQPIRPGDQIEWERGQGVEHVECDGETWDIPGAPTLRISLGSGYGGRPYRLGETLRLSNERDPDWPEGTAVTVVRAWDQYHSEDGMCFGVGDDSGYIHKAQVRAATEEEKAELVAEETAAEERRAAQDRLRGLREEIRREGEYPAGHHRLNGDRLFDTQSIYGGGGWVEIEREWIWEVENNGGDGDCWDRNNVLTGGAGAVGWRVPRTDELEAELRALSKRADEEDWFPPWRPAR